MTGQEQAARLAVGLLLAGSVVFFVAAVIVLFKSIAATVAVTGVQ